MLSSLATRTADSLNAAVNTPSERIIVMLFLLAAVWITPAQGHTGNLIQTALATLLVIFATIDAIHWQWGKGKKGAAVLCGLAGTVVWTLSTGVLLV